MTNWLDELVRWYMETYRDKTGPTQVGVEKEMPVVSDGRIPWARDARKLLPHLTGRVEKTVALKDGREIPMEVVAPNGVVFTHDGGTCTAELIIPPCSTVNEAANVLVGAEKAMAAAARNENSLILGYGSQPLEKPGFPWWGEGPTYDAIRRIWGTAMDPVTITASTQVHVDVSLENAVLGLRVFNALGSVIPALFANNPVVQGRLSGMNAWREGTYEKFGLERSGTTPHFPHLEDYLRWVATRDLMMVADGNNGYTSPQVPFWRWMENHPDRWRDDWNIHESRIWPCARMRRGYGTIEVRSACSQRSGEDAALMALVAGVASNLHESGEFVDRFPWRVWALQRKGAVQNLHPETALVCQVFVELAEAGLKARGTGEEIHLEVLKDRIERNSNPAEERKEEFGREGLHALISSVAVTP